MLRVSDIPCEHRKKLRRGLLDTAKGIHGGTLHDDLEWPLESRHRSYFQHTRFAGGHLFARSQNTQAARDMTQFTRFGDIALAYIDAAFARVTYRGSDCSRFDGKTHYGAGWNGQARSYYLSIIKEQWHDLVIVAHFDDCTAGCRSHIEPAKYGITGQDKGRDGQFPVHGLHGIYCRFDSLPVQAIRCERKGFDSVARHTIAQLYLDARFSLHFYDIVVDDLGKLQAHLCQCLNGLYRR